MRIPIKTPFHFRGAVTEHGWWMLAPNVWDEEHQIFCRSLQLITGRNLCVGVSYSEHSLEIHYGEQKLTETEKQDIRRQIAWMFRLEENFEDFYNLATKFGELNETVAQKRGRLLRSPTLFEDVTKVILTTNTSWQQTRTMTAKLVEALGEPISNPQGPLRKTFPSPEKVLDAGEDFLKREVRVGYRSVYLIDVAEKAVDPSFDLEAFKKKKRIFKS